MFNSLLPGSPSGNLITINTSNTTIQLPENTPPVLFIDWDGNGSPKVYLPNIWRSDTTLKIIVRPYSSSSWSNGSIYIATHGSSSAILNSTLIRLCSGGSVELAFLAEGKPRQSGAQTGITYSQWEVIHSSSAYAYSSTFLGAATLGGSISIGSGSYVSPIADSSVSLLGTSSGSKSISVGFGSSTSASYALAVGLNSSGGGAQGVGISSCALNGSYASGTDAFAAAITNNTSTYGAQGANSVAIGQNAKTTQSSSIAIGRNSAVTGFYAIGLGPQAVVQSDGGVAIGSAYNVGWGTKVSAIDGIALGDGAVSNIVKKFVIAGWDGTTQGGRQFGKLLLTNNTTDATPLVLVSNAPGNAGSSNNQVILPNDSTFLFEGNIVARNTTNDADSKVWTFKGAIRRGTSAATTTIIGTPTINLEASDGSAWSFTLTADTTNGGLAVTVTGEAGKTIKWLSIVDTTELTG